MARKQNAGQKILLCRADLEELGISYSNTHLLRLEAAGEFPKRVRLSPQRVAWHQVEVLQWISEKCTERDASN